MVTSVGVASPIVLQSRLVRAVLALEVILCPHFVDVFSGTAVDLVKVHVGKDLDEAALIHELYKPSTGNYGIYPT